MATHSEGDAGPSLEAQLVVAIQAGDRDTMLALIKRGADIMHKDGVHGRNMVMIAALHGHEDIVDALLNAGIPWNEADAQGLTAGELALSAGHTDTYAHLVNAGCRAELLLGLVGRRITQGTAKAPQIPGPAAATMHNVGAGGSSGGNGGGAQTAATNAEYLASPLQYNESGTKLLSSEGDGVMMGWEKPLMERHAAVICQQKSADGRAGDILNIGFGLGLVDDAIQAHQPVTHTIVEAHPDVLQRMRDLGWDRKPGVRILSGRWQDVIGELGSYDGVFFDTFGEYYEDMREFHEHLLDLLKPGGIYSFFNGLCATNRFLHDVTRTVAELELQQEFLIRTEWEEIPMRLTDAEYDWKGVKRRYWQLDRYFLPTCRAPGGPQRH